MTDAPPSVESGKPVKASEIREELNRVLESQLFDSARRSREILKYIVEQTLDGKAANLKSYTIAIDVYGKSTDFDPNTDALVRVEAGRLRSRLAEYYFTEGQSNPIRIIIERGSYAPKFMRPRLVDRNVSDRRDWKFGSLMFAALLIAGTLVALWPADEFDSASSPIDATSVATPAPRIAVAGFENLTGDPDHNDFVAGLDAEVMIRLRELGLSVVAPLTPSSNVAGSNVIPPARYVLEGSVRLAGGMMRISGQLIDPDSRAQIWAMSFDEVFEPRRHILIQEQVASRIAAILANPFGPMYNEEAYSLPELSRYQADTYACVVQFRAYASSLDPTIHERSRKCFLHVTREHEQPAQIWAGLSLVYLHEFWYSYNPQPGDALARAYNAAQVARAIDDRNLLANLALAEIFYTRGDMPAFRDAADRSIALARNPSATAQIGYVLTLTGEIDEGRRLLDAAFAAEPPIPSWYHVGQSFNALLRGQDRDALDSALRANSPDWFAASLAVAAAAGRVGETELAAHSIESLLQIQPDFSLDGYELLRNWIKSPELVERIVEGLKLGGLDVCRGTCD